jgi:hypothetical protein
VVFFEALGGRIGIRARTEPDQSRERKIGASSVDKKSGRQKFYRLEIKSLYDFRASLRRWFINTLPI